MLNYIEIILYFILPEVVFIWWLAKPFITQSDRFKFKIVYTIITVLICGNSYIFRDAKVYNVAIETYFYRTFQVIITTYWTVLCTRWTIHSMLLTKPNAIRFHITRFVPTFLFTALAIVGWEKGSSDVRLLCNYLPVIACIWFFAGMYITRCFATIAMSIIVPTAYFYYVDTVAIKNQVWYATNATFKWEIFVYYLLTNAIIVFASAAFDKSKAVLDLFYPQKQIDLKEHNLYTIIVNIIRLKRGLLSNEIDLPASTLEDFKQCVLLMQKVPSSRLFNLWVKLFSTGKFGDATLFAYYFK